MLTDAEHRELWSALAGAYERRGSLYARRIVQLRVPLVRLPEDGPSAERIAELLSRQPAICTRDPLSRALVWSRAEHIAQVCVELLPYVPSTGRVEDSLKRSALWAMLRLAQGIVAGSLTVRARYQLEAEVTLANRLATSSARSMQPSVSVLES